VVRVTLEDFAGASPLALELDIVELAGED